jgi:very-short-patch-repair endonuclease
MATIGKINPHARRLRREATDAERRLWYYLRNRRLGGFKFRQQETIGACIADFACVESRLIVEADGGQHSDTRDAARTEYLESLGWHVLRIWNNDILQRTDAVLEVILETCLERQKGKPSPCPLPRAGEGK